jgi:hypothetical protein
MCAGVEIWERGVAAGSGPVSAHHPMPLCHKLSLRWLLLVLFTGLIWLILPLVRELALVTRLISLMTGLIALFLTVGLIPKVLLLLVPWLFLGVHL